VQIATITAAAAAAAPAPTPVPVVVPILEVALPSKFSGERGQVVGFINACHLFIQIKMGQVGDGSGIS